MTTRMPPRFKQLAELYTTMDRAWNETAAQYEFQCKGCEDNCCFSLFFHHTHVEKAYLHHGFSRLPQQDQENIITRAKAYCNTTFDQNGPDAVASKKAPCPLLLDGRCRLYEFRPMICRMHGLPHELHKPGFQIFKGPGCDAGRFEEHDYVPFDRTPFYRNMAAIEMNFRSIASKTGKIKETIAQMLLNTCP